jgi:diguanylate cyclase (GGDEF)-like protein/PAS domain S-box-containing protein
MPTGLLEQALELAGNAIFIASTDGAIQQANSAALALSGYRLEELCALSLEELFHPVPALGSVGQQDATGVHGDDDEQSSSQLRNKDGRFIAVGINVNSATDGQKQCTLLTVSHANTGNAANQPSELATQRSQTISKLAADWLWEADEQLRFTTFLNYNDTDTPPYAKPLIGKGFDDPLFRFEPPAQRRALRAATQARRSFHDLVVSYEIDKEKRYFSISGEPLFDSAQVFKGYRGIAQDVSRRMRTERRLSTFRDYYALLSEINHAIIHSKSTIKLFEFTCNAAVKSGHFLFAWIGLVNNVTRQIDPVASAGAHTKFFENVRISVDPEQAERDGRIIDLLFTGEPCILNERDREAHDQLDTFFNEANVGAYAMFPLRRSGKVIGIMHLCSTQCGVFDDELVKLLSQLSENLSFALGRFEQQAAREATERALRESEKRFRDIADVAGEYLWENDRQGRFTFLTPKISEFLGYTTQELIGKPASILMPEGESERVKAWLDENMKPDGTFRGLENRLIDKSGKVRWQRVSAVGLYDADGDRIGHRGTAQDITDLKESEERIIRLATRDSLTELPNRLLFQDRLQQSIEAAKRNKTSVAVLFIDLDRFKNVNDSLGHETGDGLLKAVATRMSQCIRAVDTVARLGGDEFVICLAHMKDPADATKVAAKITEAMSRPFDVDGQQINTSSSIGISLYPADAKDASTLLRNADTAMYHAKERGRNNHQFFSGDMNERAMIRHEVEVALRKAIENEEFALVYQPQTRVSDSTVIGAEALLRWHHPERGLVPPLEFIRVAEDSGLIEPIGQWVLKEACAQLRRWQERGCPPIRVAVNISARQLLDPDAFLQYVTQTFTECAVDPRQIELEMTESLLLDHFEANAIMLRKLGQSGVRIAVDDFGTGYSSLSYIKRLPIDSIKIDRSFIRDIETDRDDAEIIRAIIAMAHGLKLRVTAEGVETARQLGALKELGCDEYQGYLVSEPIDPERFAERFLKNSPSSDNTAKKPGSSKVRLASVGGSRAK